MEGRKAVVILNHTLTEGQRAQLLEREGVQDVVEMSASSELKQIWGSIPPEASYEDVAQYIEPVLRFVDENVKKGDILIVQGEPAAAELVTLLGFARGADIRHATTRREAVEIAKEDGSVEKKSVFKHVQFRPYPLTDILKHAGWYMHDYAASDGMFAGVDLDSAMRFAIRAHILAMAQGITPDRLREALADILAERNTSGFGSFYHDFCYRLVDISPNRLSLDLVKDTVRQIVEKRETDKPISAWGLASEVKDALNPEDIRTPEP